MRLDFHGRLLCRSQVDQIDLTHGSAGIGDEGFRTGRTKNAETFAEEIVRVSSRSCACAYRVNSCMSRRRAAVRDSV